MINPNTRLATAIHEAGHAVACYRFWPGRYVGDLTVVPDVERNAAGSHETLEPLEFEVTHDPAELARQNAEFDRGAIYYCAGYAALLAAGVSAGEAALGCDSDFEHAEASASWTNTSVDVIKQRAIAFMGRPENAAAVRRIADELVARGTVPGDEVGLLIDVADGLLPETIYQHMRASRTEA